jgi:hypothetical protein
MGRGLAYKRHCNKKILKKRLSILKSWGESHYKYKSSDTEEEKSKRDGILRKQNLSSSSYWMRNWPNPDNQSIKADQIDWEY